MFRRIREFLLRIFKREVYYVGSSDILPEPLSRMEDQQEKIYIMNISI